MQLSYPLLIGKSAIALQAINWSQLPGSLKHVQVDHDNSLMGLNWRGQLYYCKDWKNCQWKELLLSIPGTSPSRLSSRNGVVCLVSSADQVFCTRYARDGTIKPWRQLPGALIDVSVNHDGSLWGVNRQNQVWYCSKYDACYWQSAPGSLYRISARNGVVCGVDSYDSGAIYCSQSQGSNQLHRVMWKRLPGALIDVSVNNDGSLWGVNKANQVWRCNDWRDCKWTQVYGSLAQLTSINGAVCGVNSSDNIFCANI